MTQREKIAALQAEVEALSEERGAGERADPGCSEHAAAGRDPDPACTRAAGDTAAMVATAVQPHDLPNVAAGG